MTDKNIDLGKLEEMASHAARLNQFNQSHFNLVHELGKGTLALIALARCSQPSAEPAPAAEEDEVLSLHRLLASEKLRADQGWTRYESKKRECLELRELIAAAQAAPAVAVETAQALEKAARMIENALFGDPAWTKVREVTAAIRALAAQPAPAPLNGQQGTESRAMREVRKQRADPKLATPGATARERFLCAELSRLQDAVIADGAAPLNSVSEQDAKLANRVRDLIADHLADNWPMVRYHLEEVEKKVRAINADYLLAQSDAAMTAAPSKQDEQQADAWVYECRQPFTDPVIWAEFFSRDKPEPKDCLRNIRPLVYAEHAATDTSSKKEQGA